MIFLHNEIKQLQKLSVYIKDEVLRKAFSYKINVFLGGAAPSNKKSIREQIEKELTTKGYWFRYEILYPEYLFEELISGPFRQDLLSLENMLAESVDVIVLVIESIGTVAELGAFVGDERLRKKLICIQDERFKKKKSFINYGPLNLIRTTKQGNIIYINPENISAYLPRIKSAINKIAKDSEVVPKITNIIQTERFILQCIYLFEPASREILINLVKFATLDEGEPEKVVEAATSAALNILRRKKMITQNAEKCFRLTQIGMEHFFSLGQRGKSTYSYDIDSMNQIRADILTWIYRKKPLNFIAIA